jgi:homoserine kinase
MLRDERLQLADELEGHPDNVAACLRGGVTFAWTTDDRVRVQRSEVHASIAPVAFVPTTKASTKKARGLLPESVPHADAAANSARSALLALALTRHPGLLLDATEDRLHQSFRASAMPRSYALVQKLRAAGVPAVISGAGPTVLALTTAQAVEDVVARAPKGWDVLPLPVDAAGASVVPLG